MSVFNVALLQILPCKTAKENLKKGIAACRSAKQKGADIALFPEMWSNGYNIPADIDMLKSQAVSDDGEFVSAFCALALELDMAIAVTFLESAQPLPRNTVVVINRHGKKILKYSKVHTCDFSDECRLGAGDGFYVSDLDTAFGTVKIGTMICYDREFPESARILMLKGAEIILVPNACPMEINRLSQLRSRAFENMLGIATCNYPEGKPDCNGCSSAFDGIAYLPDLTLSRDTCILLAGKNQGVYIARFDMDMLRNYRKFEVHGNAYRRPDKYADIIKNQICEPFIRHDRRD